MGRLDDRVAKLEETTRGTAQRAYVWVEPGQTDAEAIVLANLPPGVVPVLFTWLRATS